MLLPLANPLIKAAEKAIWAILGGTPMAVSHEGEEKKKCFSGEING